jgi:hypothetical protein
MKNLFLGAVAAAAFLTAPAKAETINCTEITSVPVVITAQGIYCLKSDKSSRLASGNIIDVQVDNVTIDLNGFKLGGLGAGAATRAFGIHASNRQNITVRNGVIRGFFRGIFLDRSVGGISSGYMIEDVLFDTNREIGVEVNGTGTVIRNNRVVNTGPGESGDAVGILVNGRNVVVADNIVSGTSEAESAEGIDVGGAALVELRNNTILDTKNATSKFAISITGSADVTVTGNRVLNAAGTGTFGVFASGATGVNCIGNTVAGFTSALPGCNFVSGNITP